MTTVTLNISSAIKKLSLISKRIPSFVAKSLTDVAELSAQMTNKSIAETYKSPTPTTTKSVIFFSAQKSKTPVKATVFVKTRYGKGSTTGTPPATYLQGTTGGMPGNKPSELRLQSHTILHRKYKLTPTRVLKRNKYGNVSRATYKNVIKNVESYKKGDKTVYVIGGRKGFKKNSSQQAIYRIKRRKTMKDKVEPLFFASPLRQTKKVFDFDDTVSEHVHRVANRIFSENADVFIAKELAKHNAL